MDYNKDAAIKISLITVCYNSAKTIEQTINSVLNQIYDNIEYILVDGNSTDDTLSIIKKYEAKFKEQGKQYKWVSEPDKGIFDAMNKGIMASSGDIVGILNSDDYYTQPIVIAKVAEAFQHDLTLQTLYFDLHYVDFETGARVKRIWKSGQYNPKRFYFGWMPAHPTFFVKKTVYDQVGLFKLDLPISADYEMILRILLKNKCTSKHIPMVIVKMRDGGNSSAGFKTRIKANLEDRISWKVNQLKPYWFTLLLKPGRKILQYIIK